MKAINSPNHSSAHPVIPRLSLLLCTLLLSFTTLTSRAQSTHISHFSLENHDATAGRIDLQMDLSWGAGFRTGMGDPLDDNWDALWVFVKYRLPDNQEWEHARLSYQGHTIPSGAELEPGLLDPRGAYDASGNPVMGVFVHRDTPGVGNVSFSGLRLRWHYQANNGINSWSEHIDLRIFAVEMVYVPPGPYALGSGGDEEAGFSRAAPYVGSAFWVFGEDELGMGTGEEDLYYDALGGGQQDPLPGDFPKGVDGFYVMKHPVSQGAWADFLNTLSPAQATNRHAEEEDHRHSISYDSGRRHYHAELPYVPKNYVSWEDVSAYLAWSGLRPMTELEYEKASRGSALSRHGAKSWGTTDVEQLVSLTDEGGPGERPSNANANAHYGGQIQGPVRSGAFARPQSTRERTGASHWAVHELSGNLREWVVSVGHEDGRAYTGRHGDGTLDGAGKATVNNWPGSSGAGTGFRGGGWNSLAERLQTSDRMEVTQGGSSRLNDAGVRGVRSRRALVRGPVLVCAGVSGVQYSTLLTGDTYSWTLPSGWLITSGEGTQTITLTAGAAGSGGMVSVSVSGGTDGGRTGELYVQVLGLPGKPGLISGPVDIWYAKEYEITPRRYEWYEWELVDVGDYAMGDDQGGYRMLIDARVDLDNHGNLRVWAHNVCGRSLDHTGKDIIFRCGLDLTFDYAGDEVTYGTVLKDYGGDVGLRCWLDRNLGASRVATSLTDSEAYGDYFQWGRLADGHHKSGSSTTSSLSSSDEPGHDRFITINTSPWDWRSPQNDNLWQGADGINNPCPTDWRLPSRSEVNAEMDSWSPRNRSGAFGSPLKWPVAGQRLGGTGSFHNVGSEIEVWSYSVGGGTNGLGAYGISATSNSATDRGRVRRHGLSVRCLRDLTE